MISEKNCELSDKRTARRRDKQIDEGETTGSPSESECPESPISARYIPWVFLELSWHNL